MSGATVNHTIKLPEQLQRNKNPLAPDPGAKQKPEQSDKQSLEILSLPNASVTQGEFLQRSPLAAPIQIILKVQDLISERIKTLDKMATGSERQIESDRKELARLSPSARAEVRRASQAEQASLADRITVETERLTDYRRKLSEMGDVLVRTRELMTTLQHHEVRQEQLQIDGLTPAAILARAEARQSLETVLRLLTAMRKTIGETRYNDLLSRLRDALVQERKADLARQMEARIKSSEQKELKHTEVRKAAEGGSSAEPASAHRPQAGTEMLKFVAETETGVVAAARAAAAERIQQETIRRTAQDFARESEVWVSVNGGLRAARVLDVLPTEEKEWVATTIVPEAFEGADLILDAPIIRTILPLGGGANEASAAFSPPIAFNRRKKFALVIAALALSLIGAQILSQELKRGFAQREPSLEQVVPEGSNGQNGS